jgi:hypothetical protein
MVIHQFNHLLRHFHRDFISVQGPYRLDYQKNASKQVSIGKYRTSTFADNTGSWFSCKEVLSEKLISCVQRKMSWDQRIAIRKVDSLIFVQ